MRAIYGSSLARTQPRCAAQPLTQILLAAVQLLRLRARVEFGCCYARQHTHTRTCARVFGMCVRTRARIHTLHSAWLHIIHVATVTVSCLVALETFVCRAYMLHCAAGAVPPRCGGGGYSAGDPYLRQARRCDYVPPGIYIYL